jgi:hypothetical protein
MRSSCSGSSSTGLARPPDQRPAAPAGRLGRRCRAVLTGATITPLRRPARSTGAAARPRTESKMTTVSNSLSSSRAQGVGGGGGRRAGCSRSPGAARAGPAGLPAAVRTLDVVATTPGGGRLRPQRRRRPGARRADPQARRRPARLRGVPGRHPGDRRRRPRRQERGRAGGALAGRHGLLGRLRRRGGRRQHGSERPPATADEEQKAGDPHIWHDPATPGSWSTTSPPRSPRRTPPARRVRAERGGVRREAAALDAENKGRDQHDPGRAAEAGHQPRRVRLLLRAIRDHVRRLDHPELRHVRRAVRQRAVRPGREDRADRRTGGVLGVLAAAEDRGDGGRRGRRAGGRGGGLALRDGLGRPARRAAPTSGPSGTTPRRS